MDMARVRSPNYPAFSLPEAIERVAKIHKVEQTTKAAPLVVVKAMGYTGLNGASLSAISALKKYGLLEEAGDNWRVSSDAMTILFDPKNSPSRAEAIRRAAFAPVLFAKLQKHYGAEVPSDENVRAFLLKDGFSISSVDQAIRAYRETMALVTELAPTYTDEIENSKGVGTQMEASTTLPSLKGAGSISASGSSAGKQVGAAIPVTKTCSISILADGIVTQAGLDKLVQYIELIKGSFPATEPETLN
jgi:hypothetical protein